MLKLDYKEHKNLKERTWILYLQQNHGRIKWYYDDIKKTASGNLIHKLDEREAAERLGIGTIIGNRNQKYKKSKWNLYLNDFLKIFEENLKNWIPISSQEPSVVIQINQKEVFDKDFVNSLTLCKVGKDFIRCFPLIGNSVELKVINPKNPWSISVSSMP